MDRNWNAVIARKICRFKQDSEVNKSLVQTLGNIHTIGTVKIIANVRVLFTQLVGSARYKTYGVGFSRADIDSTRNFLIGELDFLFSLIDQLNDFLGAFSEDQSFLCKRDPFAAADE